MKTKLSIIIVMALFSASAVFAGTDPSAFLNQGVGGRALGMGGAFVSVSDDTSAMYWNPAGLGKTDRISFSAMGQSLSSSQWDTLNDIAPSYQFVGVAIPVKSFSFPGLSNESNTFGIGMISTSLDNIPYTSVDDSGKIVRDTFRDIEQAYYISYGIPVARKKDNLFLGATIKYITQQFSKVPGATASGYDMDAGLMYGLGTLSFGIVVQRGVQLTWANGHKDAGPLTTKFGLSNLFPLRKSLSLLGSCDLTQRQGQPAMINTGAELRYDKGKSAPLIGLDGCALRAGIDGYAIEDRYDYQNFINNTVDYTIGAGINLSVLGYRLQIDYVFGSYRLGAKNRFSVDMYF
jgi:hypothetical protein